MCEELETPIFLITSKDANNYRHGSGFVIEIDDNGTYILTCAHIVRDLGGADQIEVHSLPAKVVAISEEDMAEDLAVLRLDKKLNAHKLPLTSKCRRGLKFTSQGWSLFDKKNDAYRLEDVYGWIVKLTKVKTRKQLHAVDYLKLNLSEDASLKPGFSGAPVLDDRSRTVVGIITHKEDHGKLGQAISTKSLNTIWPEISKKILRENLYDVRSICELLKSIFQDHEEFDTFCQKHLHYSYNINVSLYIKFELLVMYCNERNMFKLLLNKLEEYYPKKYKKLSSNIFIGFSPSTLSKASESSGFFLNLYHTSKSWFHKSKKSNSERSECELTLKFNDDFSKFTPHVRSAWINVLADQLEIPREQVRIMNIKKGSLFMKLSIPSNALDKLIAAYEANDRFIGELGIERILEILREDYNKENIVKLVSRIFTVKDLRDLYTDHLKSMPKQIFTTASKNQIVKDMVESALKESKIQDLLDVAFKMNHKIFYRYQPYRNEPRRPFSDKTTIIRSRSAAALTKKELIRALFYGTAAATIGSVLVHFMESLPIIRFFTFIALGAMGTFVGDAILVGANYKKDNRLGVIAVVSYLLGYILGFNIGYIIKNQISNPSAIIMATLFFLLYFVVFLLYSLLVDPYSIIRLVGISYGSYAAYKRVA